MRHRIAVVAVVALVVLAGCSGGGGSSTATEGDDTPTDTPMTGDETPTATPAMGDATPTATQAPDETATATPTDPPTDASTPTPTATATPTDAPTATATPTDAPTATATPTDAPTPTATPDPNDDTDDIPGVEDGQLTNGSKLFGGASGFSGNATVINMSIRNSTGENLDFFLKNDTSTNRTLMRFTSTTQDRQQAVNYYLTDQYNAVYNETTGEVRYGQGEQGIEFAAAFTAFVIFVPLSYVGVQDWSIADTRTIDGEEFYAFESDGVNQTALQNSDLEVEGEIQSADGTMLIRSDGFFREVSMNITATNEDGQTAEISITLSMRDGEVSVEEPDWYDESEAESQTSSDG